MTGHSNARYITERRRRDAGMTLPEVLICVTVMGLITAVLAATIMVTFRQADATEGRVNVARAEQSIDTWLPADLASTDVGRVDLPAVDISPAATPCGNCGGIDLSGANGLQLAWSTMAGSPPVEVVTRVQYQYIQVGAEWQLQRISCVGASPCRMNVVLHELEPPPNLGDLTNPYNPNADRPVWVMDVAAPQDPAELELSDNARRIVVTVNGGGAGEGAGGGVNQINLTAGGIETSEVSADEFTVPSFVRANSRCGGPVTLIVDDSGSIGGAVDSVVIPGVRAFIEAFRGTPTKVQIIQFSSEAKAIGPGGSAWHKYVDMTDDVAVNQLLSAVDGLDSDGGTNWEEAFFHTLKKSDGTAATVLPKRIVFFTDGIPTRNRTDGGAYLNGTLVNYNAGEYRRGTGWWPSTNGTAFNQESFDRADVILDAHRDIDLIFVGVGPDLSDNVSWIYNPAVYTNLNARPASSTSKLASDVIAFLLANGPTGQVPALYDGAAYTNPETADFYLQSSFNTIAFAAAMKASALKDCGGTLTLQTRFENGTPVNNEFVYENVRYRDNTGTAIVADPRRVTTSSAFRTGTFDFQLPATVPYYSVDVVPQELQTLNLYTPVGWSCRAGATPKSTVPLVIPSSPWTGITVDVRANEAVSCILTVRAA